MQPFGMKHYCYGCLLENWMMKESASLQQQILNISTTLSMHRIMLLLYWENCYVTKRKQLLCRQSQWSFCEHWARNPESLKIPNRVQHANNHIIPNEQHVTNANQMQEKNVRFHIIYFVDWQYLINYYHIIG